MCVGNHGESETTIELTFNDAKDKLSLSLFGLAYDALHNNNKPKVDLYMKDIPFVERWLTIKEHKQVKVKPRTE